nr:MAG TPA: portal protein [Caudoviricetes sp.]
MGWLDIFRRQATARTGYHGQARRVMPRIGGRLAVRGALGQTFSGAEVSRLTADWLTFPETADDIVQKYQRILVARSREQARNNDYARAFVRMCRQNIVGPRGVMLQAQSRDDAGRVDTDTNEAIEVAWARWGHRDICDVSGKHSWRALQALAVTSVVKDGEFMFRIIRGEDAGPFGMALQLLDPQRVDVQFHDDTPIGAPAGHFIRSGIEFNAFGRPIAYYFSTGRDWQVYNYSTGGRDFLRIPAAEIIHGFHPDMTGQKRGLPWMATGLLRLKNLISFEEASLVNARVGASKMFAISWREGQGPEATDDEMRDLDLDVAPGQALVLPEGAELREWSPQFPSGEFATFTKAQLRGISAGFGVLYNNLANDLEHVNFSSIRQGTLDEREFWKEMQEWLVEALIQPVFEAWLPVALLGGHITVKGRALRPEKLARYAVVAWQPRRWAWIDPRADIDAATTAKNQLLMAPSQIISEQGRDPSDVWREIAADIAEMRAAGIPDAFIESAVLGANLQATVQGRIAGTTDDLKDDPSEGIPKAASQATPKEDRKA